jgi:hypothetical protein
LTVYSIRLILFPEAVIGGITGQLGGLVYVEFSCGFLCARDQSGMLLVKPAYQLW